MDQAFAADAHIAEQAACATRAIAPEPRGLRGQHGGRDGLARIGLDRVAIDAEGEGLPARHALGLTQADLP